MGEFGPIYGVRLLESLGQPGGFQQYMPSRCDLQAVRRVSERTAAGYELLLHQWRQQAERINMQDQQIAELMDELKKIRTEIGQPDSV
jgi:hypothetical protein